MVLKVLVLYGSPREGGNTDTLMDNTIQGVLEASPGAEVTRLRAVDLEVMPCTSCGDCDKDGFCTIGDDMDDMYWRFEEADVLLVSAPVFFRGVPSQLKRVIDRCQGIWIKNFRLDKEAHKDRKPKVAGFLSACGQEGERQFQGPDNTMVAWYGTLGFHYDEKLFVEGMDKCGAIENEPQFLEEAKGLGRRLVDHLARRRRA